MFFNKKKPTEKKEILPVIDKEDIMKKNDELIRQLDELTGNERINMLDQIGIQFMEVNELDLAIEYLEKSLDERKAVGKGYTTLLKAYNMKRKIAAEAKNDQQLQYYLVKIDEMMQISKEVIRSNL